MVYPSDISKLNIDIRDNICIPKPNENITIFIEFLVTVIQNEFFDLIEIIAYNLAIWEVGWGRGMFH